MVGWGGVARNERSAFFPLVHLVLMDEYQRQRGADDDDEDQLEIEMQHFSSKKESKSQEKLGSEEQDGLLKSDLKISD